MRIAILLFVGVAVALIPFLGLQISGLHWYEALLVSMPIIPMSYIAWHWGTERNARQQIQSIIKTRRD